MTLLLMATEVHLSPAGLPVVASAAVGALACEPHLTLPLFVSSRGHALAQHARGERGTVVAVVSVQDVA